MVTGHIIGQSAITATIGSIAGIGGTSGSATLTVNAATHVSFKVTPATGTIPVSGIRQFTAIETFADGTTIDRTADSTWSSTNVPLGGPAVATVSSTVPTKGLAVANAIGQSAITATFGIYSDTATLNVNAAGHTSFKVTPALGTLPVSGIQQYTAIETFADGTTIDRTTASTWSSVNVPLGGSAVATVSSALPTKGLATANVLGQSAITATFGGYSDTATLNVSAATHISFRVVPATAGIPVSSTQKFSAIETFSDGTTIDRTAASNWSAVNVPLGGLAVATVSTSVPTKGLATGNVAGQSAVTATFGAFTDTATLTVNPATSISFKVIPATATISVLGTLQFTAIETFSDGTTLDRTLVSSWTAPDLVGLGVATIGLNDGLAKGTAAGQATITANLAGHLPATAVLTVTVPPTTPGPAGTAPILGSAATHGIIAYNAITNSAGLSSHIYGDVALTQPGPGGTIASVTGPGTNDGGVAPMLTSSIVTDSSGVNPGMITAANNGSVLAIAALPQLLIDLRSAYDDLFTRAAPVLSLTTIASAANVSGGTFPAAAPDLSGYVLSPGIYTSAGTYGLSNTLGPLVLDGGGNPDAVFIIRSTAVGPSGITSTTGSVVLRNGAQSKNVFWLVDNATIGAGTFFQGTVVAGHAITLLAHANVEGRMLAGALGLVSGAIVLTDTSVISVPR
jgi:hypothetical protein